MTTIDFQILLALIEKMCVIVVIAYLITRTRYFTEILDKKFTLENQAVLILIFGAFSIYGTYASSEMFGVLPNLRDLGPMIGGLVGGPLVGVGAGLIGGVHRYFLGGFTSVPCSLATVLAGLFGGIIYLLKKGKFIGVPGAVLFAALMESLHITMVLLLASPYSRAVMVVKDVGMPMLLSNSLGMMIFAFIISNLIKERETAEERDMYFDELERKRYELMIAHEIQQSFLPETVPSLKGFDLAAMNLPAKEVGGDFYDFIPISEDKIGLTIADVSGKNVSAALFMALSRTIVRASATGNPGVADVIEDANNLIAADAKSGMFVTLFYAILDLEERRLRYVNAGHNPPVVFNGETGDLLMLRAKGIALGVIEDAEMEEHEIVLKSGDVVVFYTDGVTEAVDDRERPFGEERFFKIIEENHNLSAGDIIEKIKDEVLSFSGDTPQFDDITLMVLKAV